MGRHAHEAGARRIRAAVGVLTVSDTRTADEDRSGQRARVLLEAAGHAVSGYAIVPDEPPRVRGQVETWLDASGCDAVVVNGGTGISPRDRTREALDGLFERRLEGFGELFRMLSFEQIGSAAMLSRADAGIARGKPLFLLPGSTAAVELALARLILPELGHLLTELRK